MGNGCDVVYKGALYKEPGFIENLSFSKGGSYIYFSVAKTETFSGTAFGTGLFDLHAVKASGDEPAQTYPVSSTKVEALSDDLLFDTEDEELIDLTKQDYVHYRFDKPLLKVGYIPNSRLVWTMSRSGQLHLLDADDGAEVLTVYNFPDNRFFAVMPGGRYDTNLSPDSELVRWVVPDDPFTSLPAETFMRDFYEPGLYKKVLDCHAARNCEDVFKTLPSVAGLNRVLPDVMVTGVAYSADGRTAKVTIEAKDGEGPDGKKSGVFDLRLYRNGREVARIPDVPDVAVDPTEDPDKRIEEWRATHKLPASKSGSYVVTVPVPTAAWHGDKLDEYTAYTAYAFNEDRIKSQSIPFYMDPAEHREPRVARAFVLNIGIDAYDTKQWLLNFSVGDARLMAARLSNIPHFETHQMTLVGEQLADGRKTRVDKTTLEGMLDQIASQATPDDIIIVTYAGHGVVDGYGNFYLVPTDATPPDGWKPTTDENGNEEKPPPSLGSIISSTALTNIFRHSQAGEIALIFDACYSAASFEGSGYKPGPFGDAGLGQLAYDKGILILAAAQSDALAHEEKSIRHGLVTFALGEEGLTKQGGDADLNGDGRILLDEWLEYVVQRFPKLRDDVKTRRWTGDSWRSLTRGEGEDKIQQPSLFDFNTEPSKVILNRPRVTISRVILPRPETSEPGPVDPDQPAAEPGASDAARIG